MRKYHENDSAQSQAYYKRVFDLRAEPEGEPEKEPQKEPEKPAEPASKKAKE